MNADRLAVLPFAICQQLGLAAGYERSFKVCGNRVLANRYLLGLSTAELTLQGARKIADQVAMPATPSASFWDLYPDANLLLIGFEDREPGSVFKLYLEFDETVVPAPGEPTNPSKRLLHRGIKWQPGTESSVRLSDYVWHHGLSRRAIRDATALLIGASDFRDELFDVIEKSLDRSDATALRYVEVIEAGRRSFDLNVYAAGLTVGEVYDTCARMMVRQGIDRQRIDRLGKLVVDRPLGHIAAGYDAGDNAFATFYYEP